jgi:AraC-like DNA-binding protein
MDERAEKRIPAATRPTIPIRYLIEVIDRARPSAGARRRVLAAVAVSPSALESPRMRLSIAQWERFHASLSKALDDETFGFLARPVPVGAYATLVRLLTGCVDVGSCLDAIARFYRLFDRHRYWGVESAGRSTRLELVPRDRAQARSIFFVHAMLLSPWRTVAWLSGRPIAIDAIDLPPVFRRFANETRYLFGREPGFSRTTPSLTFSRDALRLPIVRTPGEADAWVKTSLREALLAPPATAIEARVRALLSASKPIADMSLEEVACALHISRATLARKLTERGMSFRRVKDDVRRDHAIDLLTGTSLAIADIAERMGYSEPSAFQRAFRTWTGVSPGATRARRSR